MTDPASGSKRHWMLGTAAPFLLALAVLVAYWNVPGNAFALDDWHTIQENPAIRDWKNIPKFFTDARTFSTLSTNVDYRPVLQTTYAINYAQSGITIDPQHDAWHWTNIAIHFLVTWCIFLIGRRLFGTLGLAPVPGLPPWMGDVVAFSAALVFAVHPVTAGAVNYISARSTSLTSLFILLGMLSYMRGLARPKRWWRFAVAGVMLVIALFTKVEAIAMIPALVLAEFLLNPEFRGVPLLRRVLSKSSYIRLVPICLAGVGVLFVWRAKTLIINSDTRAGVDATDYLLTQFRAWWYYIGQLLAPVNLVADYPSYRLSHTWTDPTVLLALSGWSLVLGFALLMLRRVPVVTFLIACFFLYLAPHSSIIPLAEPVNEHRPYLPHTCIILLMGIGLGTLLVWISSRPRLAAAIVVIILAIPLTLATRERNKVWLNDLSLWGDTAKKAPDSARVQMNYGLALMRRGDYVNAEARFKETLRLAPNYHYAHTNMAIVQTHNGDYIGAALSHDAAVRIAPNLDAPYYWRALFKAGLHDVPGAAADFEKAVQLCSSPFRELAGAAECLIRLGRAADAQKYIDRGLQQDRTGKDFEAQRLSIRNLLGPADSMGQMNEGLPLMQSARYIEAEWRFREACRLDPTNSTAFVNMGIVRAAQGDPVTARQWFDSAVKLSPASDVPYYWRGRFFASIKDWEAALTDLRQAQAFRPFPARDAAALGETLLAAGRAAEAEAEFAKVDPANAPALAKERAEFRAQVFKVR